MKIEKRKTYKRWKMRIDELRSHGLTQDQIIYICRTYIWELEEIRYKRCLWRYAILRHDYHSMRVILGLEAYVPLVTHRPTGEFL